MIPQNLITALPFWDLKEKQTFRQSFCEGNLGYIECRYDRMLPFTVLHTPETSPSSIYLVQKDGERALKIDGLLADSTTTDGGLGYIFFDGALDINQATSVTEYSNGGDNPTTWDVFGSTTWADWVCDGGFYYIEMAVGSERYYSELMRISDFPEFSENPAVDTLSRIRIEGTNICAIGDLPATLNANKLFIDAKTSSPEYLIEKEVATDGNEEETAVWVKFKKRYKVTFLAIETVIDWVASLPLYGGNVNISDQYGFQGVVTDIEVDVSWPDDFGGCVAQVELSFSREYFSQTGCC